MSPLRGRTVAVVASALVLTGGLRIAGATADPLTPTSVSREALAASDHPRGADARTLGLSRVTVMPGTTLARHHHPGTQIAYIAGGTLTYSVDRGSARVMKGSADDPTLVRVVHAGQTARLHTGQWLIEQPTDHHHAANRGTVPVVIYLATLFADGTPPSIPN